ncbi:MAG: hypothetical protein HZB56_00090 [Deltaproteobacteria bacterium]|nr:hypothetical protein [Deltaproteobacteria bacterium]
MLAALALVLSASLSAPPDPPQDGQGVSPVPLVAAQAAVPGTTGEPDRLLRDGEAVVSAAARFAVEAGVPLADARLVLYDGQEALVEAEGAAEIGSASSRFTLAPTAALRPGSRYVLRLEGSQGRDVHDLSGRAFRPLSFPLRVAGEPSREEPPRRAKGKKGKRRA